MITDAQLDIEFAYTSWDESCKDLHSTLQVCRRRVGHTGDHAAGFGAGRNRWAQRLHVQLLEMRKKIV